jgi:hypothetical protein
MIERSTDVARTLPDQPSGRFARGVAGAVIGQQPGFMPTGAWPQLDAVNANSSVSVTSPAFIVVHTFQAMM